MDKVNLSEAMRQEREHRLPDEIVEGEQDHDIIHYAKEVVINRDAFAHIDVEQLEITAIRDIMRYDLRPYLRKMATPMQWRYVLDDGELKSVSCHKTYRLVFITEFKRLDGDQPFHYQHSVVRLDRDGIVNVASLQTGAT